MLSQHQFLLCQVATEARIVCRRIGVILCQNLCKSQLIPLHNKTQQSAGEESDHNSAKTSIGVPTRHHKVQPTVGWFPRYQDCCVHMPGSHHSELYSSQPSTIYSTNLSPFGFFRLLPLMSNITRPSAPPFTTQLTPVTRSQPVATGCSSRRSESTSPGCSVSLASGMTTCRGGKPDSQRHN